MLRTIGMMSGTSLDGVDAAWVETDGERIGRLGPRLTLPYDDGLRRDLRALLDRANAAAAGNGLPVDDPLLLDCTRRLTLRHAEAVAAIAEDADLIGLSVLSGAHMTLFRKLIALLEERDASDIVVFGGGIVPEEDVAPLQEIGVAKIFTPGATTGEITGWVRERFPEG